MSLKVVGYEELRAKIERFRRKVDPSCVKALKETAVKIRDEAKENCPVDTGSLKKSIRIITVARPARQVKRIGVRAGGYITNPKTGRTVDYAVPVHFGTSKMPGRPFLTDAIRGKINPLMKKMLRRLAEGV